jgi:hypothetical protein
MKRSLSVGICSLLCFAGAAVAQTRGFFLTKNAVQGNAAIQECQKTPGYHMASLWEIYSLSGLKYQPTLGFTFTDSGSGPPSGGEATGWVRTGMAADGLPQLQAGTASCTGWTSNASSQRGSAVYLNPHWDDLIYPASATTNTLPQVLPWKTAVSGGWAPQCNSSQKVWCVQD